MRGTVPAEHCSRQYHPEDTVVEVGGVKVGGGHFALIAGPCSVETREQIIATTAADVRALAEPLADVAPTRGICVFGSRDAIQASGIDFEVVELMGAGEA